MRMLAWIALLSAVASASSRPKLVEGDVASQPIQTRDGGYVLFEVRVSRAGVVTELVELSGTAPYAETVREKLKDWRFAAATDDNGVAVPDSVLVAAVFRAPLLVSAIPPLPKTPRAENASTRIPYPIKMAVPPYPPQALFPGVVLLEVDLDVTGDLLSSRVIGPAGAFDGVSLDTIQLWEFRPSHLNGAAVSSRAYVMFGYRPPISPPRPEPDP